MTIVTLDEVLEVGNGTYVTEASTIGLRPGQWPRLLETTLGNGCPFVLQAGTDEHVKTYMQEFGCIFMKVYND